MAIPISQEVDLLIKKLDGVAKTDTATNKSPSNESIPSPWLNRGDTCWTEASIIPTTAVSTPNLINSYQGNNAIQCTADTTTVPVGGIFPTWLTGLNEFVPPEFGSTYSVQAYVGPPGAANIVATGTFISAAGQGGTGEYYFDYQAGLLNFIGQTIPASLTSGNVIYITGYTYVGLTGVTNLPTNSNIGNINVADTTFSSTNANLIAFSGTSGVVLPAGTSGQQPGTPPTGTTRFNTTGNYLETWNGITWITGGGGGSGPGAITDQQITPNGIDNSYSLNEATTASSIFVAINGINQLPDVAYTVAGNTITFANTPLTADIIDIRYVSYFTEVSALINSTGNTSVSVTNSETIELTTSGNLAATVTATGKLQISGQSLQLPTYTVAQASAIATPQAGEVIYVSNGDAGVPSLAVYDGSSWKRISLGATISAT